MSSFVYRNKPFSFHQRVVDFVSGMGTLHPVALSLYGQANAPLFMAIWLPGPPPASRALPVTSPGPVHYYTTDALTEQRIHAEVTAARVRGHFPVLVAAFQDGNAPPLFTVVFQEAVTPEDLDFDFFTGLTSADVISKNSAALSWQPPPSSATVGVGQYPTEIYPYGAYPNHRYAAIYRRQPPARRTVWWWNEYSISDQEAMWLPTRAGMFYPARIMPILDATGTAVRLAILWRDETYVPWPTAIADDGFDCGVVFFLYLASPEPVFAIPPNSTEAFDIEIATADADSSLMFLSGAVVGTSTDAFSFVLIVHYGTEQPLNQVCSVAKEDSCVFPPAVFDSVLDPYVFDGVANSGAATWDTLDMLMLRLMVIDNARAAQIAIAFGGQLMVNRAYTNGEEGYPQTRTTNLMRVGSCSKTLAAMASVRLASLEASAAPSAPPLFQQTLAARMLLPPEPSINQVPSNPVVRGLWTVTVDDLLHHTSGLNGDTPTLASQGNPVTGHPYANLGWMLRANLQSLTAMDLNTDPMNGTPLFVSGLTLANFDQAIRYSSFGYVLLQEIVETAPAATSTGAATLDDFIHNELMDPLSIPRPPSGPHILATTIQASTNEVLYHSIQPDVWWNSDNPQHDPGFPLWRPMTYNYPTAIQAGSGGWSIAVVHFTRLLASLDAADPSALWTPAEQAEILAPFTLAGQTNARGWDFVEQVPLAPAGLPTPFRYIKTGGDPGITAWIYYRAPVYLSGQTQVVPSLAFAVSFNRNLNASPGGQDEFRTINYWDIFSNIVDIVEGFFLGAASWPATPWPL